MFIKKERETAQIRQMPNGKEFSLFIKNGRLFFESPILFEFYGGVINSIEPGPDGKLNIIFYPLDYPSDSLELDLVTICVDKLVFF